MPPGEIDAIAKAFPHIRARDVPHALAELPELRASRLGSATARPAVRPGRAARRAAPPHRAAPVRGAAVRRHPARPHPGRGELAGLPDEPVRQGRRRGRSGCSSSTCSASGCSRRWPTPSRRSRGSTGDADRPRRPGPGAARRPGDLRADPLDPHPRLFQIESPGQRELVGKFGPETFERPHHRHLAVPARPGQERHGHAVPQGPAGLERAAVPAPRRCVPALRGDLRASSSSTSRCCRSSPTFTGCHAGRGRRGAPRARHPDGPARGRGVVAAARRCARGYDAADRRPDLGGAQGVRVVRVLQGPRRGVRAADLPVGLAQDPPPGRVPRRGAHPRPRHVPQAADPRRRPPVRHRGAAARRQRLRRAPTASSGSTAADDVSR